MQALAVVMLKENNKIVFDTALTKKLHKNSCGLGNMSSSETMKQFLAKNKHVNKTKNYTRVFRKHRVGLPECCDIGSCREYDI